MKRITHLLASAALLTLAGSMASAQSTVTLPDSSQTTTMTANVSEQCHIVVPTGVTFNVTDISVATPASAATVTITDIVLATATKQLKISVEAAASSFTPSVTGATTWAAGDISWNAASWTNATGAAGTLSSSAYNEVATAAADSADASTSALVFTLAPNTSVKRSGNHTLILNWKVESIGS
jgi:hypothetical protein